MASHLLQMGKLLKGLASHCYRESTTTEGRHHPFLSNSTLGVSLTASTLRSRKYGVDLPLCSFSVSLVSDSSLKDLPKPGIKVEKKLDAWSSSSEGKGGMKV